eukprot:CAMPEP_0184869214 /NCGR_PEP_ID=MMETSP0580-20130426/33386_1 /TAXON_ID=1118495 /ORGANISM="Dactyliosolen fragilissimus" /LENGTH=381 /DNA_ID=CAMNT_0027370563 /DNA_START=150 /DNA_END=1295 /DNA_ORIENTATION=+
MTFLPIEFFGIELFRLKEQPWGIFGWQGIIPTKAEKMASITCDLMLEKLLDIQTIFDRLEPQKFAHAMNSGLILLMDQIVEEVAMMYMPKAWETLPKKTKDDFIIAAVKECPEFLTKVMKDMQNNIHDILDIKQMTVEACVQNKVLINEIFLKCGDKEFTFIRRSGFYFGFLFGCIQMIIWFFYTAKWVLPVCGFIVGWLTNYIALKIIFRPLEPKKLCCGIYTLHGLFLKRQMEVSEVFAEVICVKILHTKALWDAILTGPLHKHFEAMLRARTILFTEKLMGSLHLVAVIALGKNNFQIMKEDIATKVIQKLPDIIHQSYEYTTEALDIENTMRTKMQALSSINFEGVLHPAFEEDEITLIMVGGFLGAIVGVAQMFMF